MNPQEIALHIETLVLHGFAPEDRHAIGEAVQQELQRLFTGQGMPEALTAGYEAATLNAGAFTVMPGAKARTIGTQVAQAVYAGLATGEKQQASRKE